MKEASGEKAGRIKTIVKKKVSGGTRRGWLNVNTGNTATLTLKVMHVYVHVHVHRCSTTHGTLSDAMTHSLCLSIEVLFHFH